MQISGGEPSIHPQILEIIEAARRRPIQHVMLSTSGIRIAEDPAFVDRRRSPLRGLPAVDCSTTRRCAASAPACRASVAMRWPHSRPQHLDHLVCTVKRGVNDGDRRHHQARAEVQVRARHQLPAGAGCGRNEGFDPSRSRVVLSEIRRRIVEVGHFADGDMIRCPCNPASISIGYGLRDEGAAADLAGAARALLPVIPNAISFEISRAAPAPVDLLSLRPPTPTPPSGWARCCCRPRCRCRRARARTSSGSRSSGSLTASISASATSSARASIKSPRRQDHSVRHVQHVLPAGRRR